MKPLAPVLGLLLALAGCGGDEGPCSDCTEDAGRPDGGASDLGLDAEIADPDAGREDAGVADAGPMDMALPDLALADAGIDDAGADAGVEDAGMDAGIDDAGMDAGIPDAGTPWSPCGGGTGDHTVVTGVQPGLPRIVWTGSDYALGYYGKAAAGAAFESFVGRVDALGAVTRAPAQVTPDDGELSIWIRVARSDRGFGIVTLDDRGARRQAYFARLDDTGALVAGSEIQLSDDADTVASHAIAYDPTGDQFGVAWTTNTSEIHFARVSAAGALLAGPAGSQVDAGSFDYSGTPLVWADDRFAIVSSPLGITEIAGDGTVLRFGDIEAATVLHRPSLAWSGIEYGVVWRRPVDQSIRFTRIDGTGRVPGSERTLHPGPWAGEADIVWADLGEWGVTWNVGHVGDPLDIHFARLAPDGTLRSNAEVLGGPVDDSWPQLTWCGQYAIVYQHGRTAVDETGELHLFFP